MTVLAGFDDPAKTGGASPALGEIKAIDTLRVVTTTDTITLPNHGLKTGDIVVYHMGTGAVISGLAD